MHLAERVFGKPTSRLVVNDAEGGLETFAPDGVIQVARPGPLRLWTQALTRPRWQFRTASSLSGVG